jgi:hypothetical protein
LSWVVAEPFEGAEVTPMNMRPLALVAPLLLAGCAEGFVLDSVADEDDESAFPDVSLDAPSDSKAPFVPVYMACSAASDCDDANACTTDHCAAGGCVHTEATFDDENPCTIERCDPVLGFSSAAVAESDGDPCTEDLCIPEYGTTIHPPVRLDDEDVCTLDFCDSSVGIYREPLDCNDSSACTEEKCHSHVGCVYTPVVYFADDFSRPDHWILGAGFDVERGTPDVIPAEEQPGHPDLALVLRERDGLPFAEVGSAAEATSLAIDLGGIETRAWLTFDHAVTGAIAPGTARLQAFDGELWHDLKSFSGEASPRWDHTTVDVTEYAGSDFQLRFIVDATDPRLVGFVVDDLRILPEESCP